jgi:hypothetical protein
VAGTIHTMNPNKLLSMNNAQRTNFQTAMPRIATKPGQQRQVKPRSANRGKAAMPGASGVVDPTAMIRKMAAFKPTGV